MSTLNLSDLTSQISASIPVVVAAPTDVVVPSVVDAAPADVVVPSTGGVVVTADGVKRGRKPGSKNAIPTIVKPAKEVKEAKEPKEKKVKEEVNLNPENLALVTAFDFVNKHSEKLNATKIVGLKFDDIKADEYLMFKGEGKMYLHSDMDALNVIDFTPATIKVSRSGIIMISDNVRCYVGKTFTAQYIIDSTGVPSKAYNISNRKAYSSIVKTGEDISLDELKLYIQKSSPKLFLLVKDATTKTEIKDATLKFMTSVVDINHLIKLEEEILMKFNF